MPLRLALGSVQFGLDYGVTNRLGRVDRATVGAILARSAEAGIDTIDTAALYGTSEEVLGEALGASGWDHFRVVTKTAKRLDAQSPAAASDVLRRDLEQSLERLRATSVDGLLVHDPQELLGEHGPVRWQAMEKAKAEGLVRRIGASVYSGGEIDALLDRYPLDLVQLPLNIIDRRLIDGGQLDRLGEAEVAVHARSAFLQGLLLAPAQDLEERFGPLRSVLTRLDEQARESEVSRLALCLSGVLRHEIVERVVIGVTSLDELNGILAAYADATCLVSHPEPFDIDERFLDPTRWPQRA